MRSECRPAAFPARRSSWGAPASCTVAPPTSRWTLWQVHWVSRGGCAGGAGPRGRSLTPRLPPGMLLSRRAELKPLRVYSEQAEATEFPVPGVSSRGPLRKTPREGRPNQSLRCRLSVSLYLCVSVCLWVEGRGLSCLMALPWAVGFTGVPPPGPSHCTTGSGSLPTPSRPPSRLLTPGCREGRCCPRRTSSGKQQNERWSVLLVGGSLGDGRHPCAGIRRSWGGRGSSSWTATVSSSARARVRPRPASRTWMSGRSWSMRQAWPRSPRPSSPW